MKKQSIILSLVLLIISVIYFVLGYTQLIVRETRPDIGNKTSLGLIGWYAYDFRVYLSAVTLGKHNYLFFRNPFSIEDFKSLPFYLYYSTLGFITKPFALESHVVYHIAKIISYIAFIAAPLFLSWVIVKKYTLAVISTILTITAAPPRQRLFLGQDSAIFGWWDDWLQASERLHQRPHYVLSQAGLVASIGLFFFSHKQKSPALFILTTIVSIITVILVPHSILPFWAIVTLHTVLLLFKVIKNHNRDTLITILVNLCILLPGIITVLYMRQAAINDVVWNLYKSWEIDFWKKDPYFFYNWYVSFYSLLIPSSLFLLIHYKKILNSKIQYLVLWILFPLLCIPFLEILGIAQIRLIHFSIHIPLAIITVWGVSQTRLLKKTFIWVLLIFLYTFSLTPTIAHQYRVINKAKNEMTHYNLIYVTPTYIDVLEYAKKNFRFDTKILSGETLANLLPGYAPVRTFFGHHTQIINGKVKFEELLQFYSGNSESFALQMIQRYKFDYVIDDLETKWIRANTELPYTFLTKVFSNEHVTIYKVNLDP